MSSIAIKPEWNVKGIAESAGAEKYYVRGNSLHCDCDQIALNSALAAYDHNAYLLEMQPTYRDLRSTQYKERLSPEGDFETTVGDIIDALIKAHYGDSSELDQLALLINEIKTEIPES